MSHQQAHFEPELSAHVGVKAAEEEDSVGFWWGAQWQEETTVPVVQDVSINSPYDSSVSDASSRTRPLRRSGPFDIGDHSDLASPEWASPLTSLIMGCDHPWDHLNVNSRFLNEHDRGPDHDGGLDHDRGLGRDGRPDYDRGLDHGKGPYRDQGPGYWGWSAHPWSGHYDSTVDVTTEQIPPTQHPSHTDDDFSTTWTELPGCTRHCHVGRDNNHSNIHTEHRSSRMNDDCVDLSLETRVPRMISTETRGSFCESSRGPPARRTDAHWSGPPATRTVGKRGPYKSRLKESWTQTGGGDAAESGTTWVNAEQNKRDQRARVN